MSIRIVSAAFVVVFVVLGCSSGGSSGGTAACSPFTACGGDVTGTWSVTGVCITGVTDSSCTSATLAVTAQPSGTLTFNANGSYSDTATITATESATIPASCLSGASDCTAFETALQGQTGVSGATCTGNVATSCQCSIVLTPQTDSNVGTYTTAGTALTRTPTGATATTTPYCVQGNTLRLQVLDSSGATTTLTATK